MSMRLRIPCPHCGIRAVEEFVYGELPDVPAALTDHLARELYGLESGDVVGPGATLDYVPGAVAQPALS